MIKQDYDYCNSEKDISTTPCKETHGKVSELPQSINREPIRSKMEVVKEVDIRNTTNEDESDSEVYIFKRRSSIKVQKRIAHDLVSSNTDQQVNISCM